jgi:hypothetical protein
MNFRTYTLIDYKVFQIALAVRRLLKSFPIAAYRSDVKDYVDSLEG